MFYVLRLLRVLQMDRFWAEVNTCSPQHLSIIVYSFAQMMAAGVAPEGRATAPSAGRMVEVVLDAARQRVRPGALGWPCLGPGSSTRKG